MAEPMSEIQRSPDLLPDFSFRELAPLHAYQKRVLSNWGRLVDGDRDLERQLETLIRQSFPRFLNEFSIDTRACCPDSDRGYCWRTLVEEPPLTIGVLDIPAGGNMPAHDHPGSTGFGFVLHGHPWMIETNGVHPGYSHFQWLFRGDYCFTYPLHHNIHGFYALDEAARLISVRISPLKASTQQRRWWFSLDHNERLKQRLAQGLLLLAASPWSLASPASDCALHNSTLKPMHSEHWTMPALLHDCAEAGHADAQYELGNMYLLGHGVQKDAATAAHWYHHAAQQGHVEAQYSYGLMLLDGNGVTEDTREGFDWVFKAAFSGHGEAKKVFEYLLENPAPLDC